jgi:hypothetical protein
MKLSFIKRLTIALLAFINTSIYAQTSSIIKKNNLYLNTFAGYGTENNQGNTDFFAGLTLSKPVKKHLFLEVGLTRFTTDIYNVYKAKPTNFDGEDRKYNAWFLTADANYTFGNKQSLLNASIKIGPSLKYYNLKAFSNGSIRVYPDGREEPVLGTIKYEEKKGINISLYNSVSFDAKVTPNLRAGVFLDVYSTLIPIEHFMPGINVIFKL